MAKREREQVGADLFPGIDFFCKFSQDMNYYVAREIWGTPPLPPAPEAQEGEVEEEFSPLVCHMMAKWLESHNKNPVSFYLSLDRGNRARVRAWYVRKKEECQDQLPSSGTFYNVE